MLRSFVHRTVFVLFSLILFLSHSSVAEAVNCYATLSPPTNITRGSTLVISVSQTLSRDNYNIIITRNERREAVGGRVTPTTGRVITPRLIVYTGTTPRANTNGEVLNTTVNLASLSGVLPFEDYTLLVQDNEGRGYCDGAGNYVFNVTISADTKCEISNDNPPAGKEVTYRFQNPDLANKTLYFRTSWGGVGDQPVTLDASGSLEKTFIPPPVSDTDFTRQLNGDAVSLTDRPGIIISGPTGSCTNDPATNACVPVQIYCRKTFKIAPPASPEPPSDECSTLAEDPHPECGATCEGVTTASNELSTVYPYSCADGSTIYKCQSYGQVPGQCGVPLDPSSRVSCDVCPIDKPIYDSANQRCCSQLLSGQCKTNYVNRQVIQCDAGVACTPGKGCGDSSHWWTARSNVCQPGDTKCSSAAGAVCRLTDGKVVPPKEVTNYKKEELGISTAIGCVPTEPQALIQGLMKVGTGAAGAIALLLMIGGAFQMITSAGNAETLKKGQQQFTSAIIGLLFIIFSILLLQVIGVDILQIPGFGK